ncbi:hypothetical protein GCM10009854_27810 [Saccharopolyspora halophila]|uniref:Uncharacterized protein n=1 Tax=Saccharopolyspora halophila TaxID=405551 RepID=A0ABP5TBK8_9PSEU
MTSRENLPQTTKAAALPTTETGRRQDRLESHQMTTSTSASIADATGRHQLAEPKLAHTDTAVSGGEFISTELWSEGDGTYRGYLHIGDQALDSLTPRQMRQLAGHLADMANAAEGVQEPDRGTDLAEQVERLTAERDAAIRQADEYSAELTKAGRKRDEYRARAEAAEGVQQ